MTYQDKIEFLSGLINRATYEAYEAEFTEDDPRRSGQLRAIVFWLVELRTEESKK